MYRRKKWKREPQAEKWTLKVFARNCEGTEQLRIRLVLPRKIDDGIFMVDSREKLLQDVLRVKL